LVVGVVAKPPFPLSPAKTGRDIGDEDRASAMFVDAGDRCRPTIAPPPAVGGAQATLRCGRPAVRTKEWASFGMSMSTCLHAFIAHKNLCQH
jgi:hypothetical protein